MQLKTGLPRPRWSGTHTGLIASFKCAHVPRSSGLDSRSLHRCRAADAQHIAPSVSSSDVQPSTSSVLDSPGVTEAPVPTFEQLGVDRMFLVSCCMSHRQYVVNALPIGHPKLKYFIRCASQFQVVNSSTVKSSTDMLVQYVSA